MKIPENCKKCGAKIEAVRIASDVGDERSARMCSAGCDGLWLVLKHFNPERPPSALYFPHGKSDPDTVTIEA